MGSFYAIRFHIFYIWNSFDGDNICMTLISNISRTSRNKVRNSISMFQPQSNPILKLKYIFNYMKSMISLLRPYIDKIIKETVSEDQPTKNYMHKPPDHYYAQDLYFIWYAKDTVSSYLYRLHIHICILFIFAQYVYTFLN